MPATLEGFINPAMVNKNFYLFLPSIFYFYNRSSITTFFFVSVIWTISCRKFHKPADKWSSFAIPSYIHRKTLVSYKNQCTSPSKYVEQAYIRMRILLRNYMQIQSTPRAIIKFHNEIWTWWVKRLIRNNVYAKKIKNELQRQSGHISKLDLPDWSNMFSFSSNKRW